MDINNHIKPTIEQEKSCEEKGMPNCPKKNCNCITFAQSHTCQKIPEFSAELALKESKLKMKRKRKYHISEIVKWISIIYLIGVVILIFCSCSSSYSRVRLTHTYRNPKAVNVYLYSIDRHEYILTKSGIIHNQNCICKP